MDDPSGTGLNEDRGTRLSGALRSAAHALVRGYDPVEWGVGAPDLGARSDG